MMKEKDKESNLDFNLPVAEGSFASGSVGFQDSSSAHKEMAFESSDDHDLLVDDDIGTRNSLSDGVRLSNKRRRYSVEGKGKAIVVDLDDDGLVENLDLDFNRNLDVNGMFRSTINPVDQETGKTLDSVDQQIERNYVQQPIEDDEEVFNWAAEGLLMLSCSNPKSQQQQQQHEETTERNLMSEEEVDEEPYQETRATLNLVGQLSSRLRRETAKAYADKYANPQQEQEQHKERTESKLRFEVDKELNDDSQSPFALAIEAIKQRSQNVQKNKSLLPADLSSQSLIKEKNEQPNRVVPKLVDLCLNVLAVNADRIVSLQYVPDEFKHKLSKKVSNRGKLDSHFLELLAGHSPTEIRVWDISRLTEDDFIKIFRGCDTANLRVLQLDLCGQCMTEYVLLRILDGPLCRLHNLATVSLKGALRLVDSGLLALARSAPALLSINLSQCSLLTSDGIYGLASHLKSTLRELYLDDCQNIDAMVILPALKKFKHLEVLSVAGIQTVTDDFVIGVVEACGINMKELGLAECMKLTDVSFKFVAKACPRLCALDISHLHNLTDSALRYLANGCETICELKLSRNDFSDEAIAAFLEASGSSLRVLSLNNNFKVDLNTALSIAKCLRNLRVLDLSWCRKLTNEAVILIVDSCSSLKVLKLFGYTQVTDTFLKDHSHPHVHIIGSHLTPFLVHIDLLEHQEAPLKYTLLITDS